MSKEKSELPDAPPPPMQSLGRLLNNATRQIMLLAENRFAEDDISLPQYVVLTALWRADGLKISHLADYCGNGLPALSRLLDRMEAKDLVERRASPEDRRAVRVFLTDKGHKLSPLLERYKEFHEIMMADMAPEERQTLFSLLERLDANGEAYNKQEGSSR